MEYAGSGMVATDECHDLLGEWRKYGLLLMTQNTFYRFESPPGPKIAQNHFLLWHGSRAP